MPKMCPNTSTHSPSSLEATRGGADVNLNGKVGVGRKEVPAGTAVTGMGVSCDTIIIISMVLKAVLSSKYDLFIFCSRCADTEQDILCPVHQCIFIHSLACTVAGTGCPG